MSARTCPGCGTPVRSLFESLLHCDPVEPIDDITDDDSGVIRGID